MTDKLAVIILDALDPINIRGLDMDYVEGLMMDENSESLGISTLPYTAQSNPMIWGGYYNEDKFWVDVAEGEWSAPAGSFNREKEEPVDNAQKMWERDHFDTTFIWDELHHQGVDSSAIQIPMVLPPHTYNPVDGYEMGGHWFPHTMDHIREHGIQMPQTIGEHVRAGKDFIATSIQIPDKILHNIMPKQPPFPESKDICSDFEEEFEKLIDLLESNGYDWMILGDHGSPKQGNIRNPENKHVVPNHRKHSVIISNRDDWDLPTYTDEIYDFMKDKFDAEAARPDREVLEEKTEEAVDVLEDSVGDDSMFLFTGGKEALVISHMLRNKVDGGSIPYGVVDTGNHFDSMYDFRQRFVGEHGVDLQQACYTELLDKVILNEDDPRGFHGTWDDSKTVPEDAEGIQAVNATPEEWGVEQSCGALKVNGIKQFIEDGYTTLVTGQRGQDLTIGDETEVNVEREEPLPHVRVNPLVDWTTEEVWMYIDMHNLDYPEIYDRGYDHTDAKCCTKKPDDIGEYGEKGSDVEKEQAKEKLKELGYI